MIPTRWRFALIFLLFVSGTLSVFIEEWSWKIALALWGTGLFMLLGHFRYGNVLSALIALRKGKVQEAERILLDIKRPDWLSKRYQAYHAFAWGLIYVYQGREAQDKDQQLAIWDKAEQSLQLALAKGLKQATELSLTYINLAHLAFSRRQFDRCEDYIAKIRALDIKDLFMQERLSELEEAIAKERQRAN